MNVLLVEDEVNARDVYADLIRHAGHHVATADSASAAVTAIDAGPIDVAVVDVVLGGPDGFVVVAYLKQRQPLARAVIVTAHDVAGAAFRGRALGADAMLSKPIKWEDLEPLLRPSSAAAGETR